MVILYALWCVFSGFVVGLYVRPFPIFVVALIALVVLNYWLGTQLG
jgi:hypothetical protein